MTTILSVAIAGILALLWIGAIVAYIVYRRPRTAVEQRLGQYTSAVAEAAGPAPESASAKRSSSVISEQLSQALAGRKFADGMLRDLARADLKLNVAEYLAAHVLVAAATAALVWWF